MVSASQRCLAIYLLLAAGLSLALSGPQSAVAARLVPALVTETVQRETSFPRGSVDEAFVYQDGVYVGGEEGDWPLGEYRIAGERVDATMIASFNNGAYSARTYATAQDVNRNDFYPAESTPEVRKVWFYVAPQDGEAMGTSVTLNLSLAWQANQIGSSPTATLTPFVDGEFEQIPRLTRNSDQRSETVRVGNYYRLDITHPAEVVNGTILSAAAFDASLQPLSSVTAPTPILPGDYNQDGAVDSADYSVWRDGLSGPYDFNLDGDGNGSIDQGDYGVWASWYGTVAPAMAVAVPEPAALFLVMLAVTAGARCRR